MAQSRRLTEKDKEHFLALIQQWEVLAQLLSQLNNRSQSFSQMRQVSSLNYSQSIWGVSRLEHTHKKLELEKSIRNMMALFALNIPFEELIRTRANLDRKLSEIILKQDKEAKEAQVMLINSLLGSATTDESITFEDFSKWTLADKGRFILDNIGGELPNRPFVSILVNNPQAAKTFLKESVGDETFSDPEAKGERVKYIDKFKVLLSDIFQPEAGLGAGAGEYASQNQTRRAGSGGAGPGP